GFAVAARRRSSPPAILPAGRVWGQGPRGRSAGGRRGVGRGGVGGGGGEKSNPAGGGEAARGWGWPVGPLVGGAPPSSRPCRPFGDGGRMRGPAGGGLLSAAWPSWERWGAWRSFLSARPRAGTGPARTKDVLPVAGCGPQGGSDREPATLSIAQLKCTRVSEG